MSDTATKETFLREAYALALASPDKSCQNGAIVVAEDGRIAGYHYNGFARGVLDLPDRHERPRKYEFFRHAERGAIYLAANNGISTRNGTLYCPWFACAACAIAIIESGISHIVGHKQRMDNTPDRWKESIADAFTQFEESGVTWELYDGALNCAPILVDGKLWTP